MITAGDGAVNEGAAVAYREFLTTKRLVVPASGRAVAPEAIHPSLFPFQRDLVRWAARKGRAALFTTTGTGKTRMQLEWARLTGERALVLAPLAVAQQTVREGRLLDLDINYARGMRDAPDEGITVTNYEMLARFDASQFGAVVLDESSILKAFDGKTRTQLIETFRETPYRLCCTATPAPNDIAEIANHAEFLGVMSRAEMLAAFFVHDDAGWRLKGHAAAAFYRWLASWSMSLTKPSDLGYSNEGYDLPALTIEPVFVETGFAPEGRLFALDLNGVTERASVRRGTIEARVDAALELLAREPEENWICWCGLNEEGERLYRALVGAAVLVEGNQAPAEKASRLLEFVEGRKRVLISKPSIAGMGLNLQHCARMVFVGLSDSYEQYFQCIRRCWRYGQERPVKAYIVLSELERTIYENVLRKEREAETTMRELVGYVAEFERAEMGSTRRSADYAAEQALHLPAWLTGA